MKTINRIGFCAALCAAALFVGAYPAGAQIFCTLKTLKQTDEFSVADDSGKLRLQAGNSMIVKTNTLTQTETFAVFPDEIMISRTFYGFSPEATILSGGVPYFISATKQEITIPAKSTGEGPSTNAFEMLDYIYGFGSESIGTVTEPEVELVPRGNGRFTKRTVSVSKRTGAIVFELINPTTNSLIFVFECVSDDYQSFQLSPKAVGPGKKVSWPPSLSAAKTELRKLGGNTKIKTFGIYCAPTVYAQ